MEHTNQNILDIMRFRFACKSFDSSRKVSAEDFDTILEAARLSPTSFGLEPWHMIIVQDEGLKQKLHPIAWGARNSLNGASHLAVLLARKKADTLYSSDYITYMMQDVQKLPPDIEAGKRQTFENFQRKSFALLDSDRALFDWAGKQAYIVLANMLTAAAALGIDSCAIEGFDQKEADALFVSEGLFDPEHFGVAVMAGFGYRAEEPLFAKTRQSLDDLVTWH